jgi:uncharacterized membrane protein
MEIVGENRNFDKTMGIVAYMTLIGWVVALVINGNKQGEEKAFTAFHLRQMLGLIILSIAINLGSAILMFIPFIGWLAQISLFMMLFIFWLIAVVGASNGETKELPLIGGSIQSLFGKAFE